MTGIPTPTGVDEGHAKALTRKYAIDGQKRTPSFATLYSL